MPLFLDITSACVTGCASTSDCPGSTQDVGRRFGVRNVTSQHECALGCAPDVWCGSGGGSVRRCCGTVQCKAICACCMQFAATDSFRPRVWEGNCWMDSVVMTSSDAVSEDASNERRRGLACQYIFNHVVWHPLVVVSVPLLVVSHHFYLCQFLFYLCQIHF